MNQKKPFLPWGRSRCIPGLSAWGPSSWLCCGSCRFIGFPGNYLSFLGVCNEEVSAGRERHRAGRPSRCVLQGCLPVLRVLPSLCAGPSRLRAPFSLQCSPGGCFTELVQKLLVIMVGKQIINNVQEVAIP